MLVLFLFPAVSSAQQPDTAAVDSVIRVEGVTVTMGRAVTSPGGTSVLEIRIDSLPVPPAPTLEQVLREVPLVQVRTNSRGEAQPALRGSEERQIAVLLDGVPLTLGWDHRTDLSIIPLTAVQTLQVHRGLASMLHGPNVLGGVLEVGTGRSDAPIQAARPLELSAGADHLGGHGAAAVVARAFDVRTGRTQLRAGLGHRGRPALPLPDGVRGFSPTDGRRHNSDLSHVDGFVAGRWLGGGGAWLSAAGSGYRAERGVPPEIGAPEPRWWRYPLQWRTLAALSGGTGMRETRWGIGDVEASVGLDVGGSEIDAYESGAYRRVVAREDAADRTHTLRLLGDHTLGERGEMRGAVTYADVSHDEVIGPGEAGDCPSAAPEACEQRSTYRQRLWSAGLEVSGPLLGGRVSAGAAIDGADTPESGGRPPLSRLTEWGARMGATRLLASTVLLHAGVSRRARFPSLRELYSGALGRFEPNPGLRAEVQVAGEAGATWRGAQSQLQAVGFHHRLRGAVMRVPTPDGRLRRENRKSVHSTGLELLGSRTLGPLAIGADLTLQQVRVQDDGDSPLPAEYQPEVVAGVDAGVLLPWRMRAAAAATYMGAQHCVTPGSPGAARLEPWSRLDGSLSRTFPLPGRKGGHVLDELSATVAVDNLMDATAWDQCGLPQPGRLIRLQVRLF